MTLFLLCIWACAPKTDSAVAPITPDAATAPGLPSPETLLPRTPDLVEGTLENGMSWYIRHNTEPAARAELRLVVRVGSVYEDDDQRGLAHLLEHMAFNGTANFAEDELVATLEGLGMAFGAHTNAHTSTDETVYKLQVPTDDPVALDTAFTVLGDWAHAMTLADDAIDRERGVVLEEWRRTRGVSGRIQDATWPALWGESPYADRRTIGTEESLKGFENEAVRRFYRDWDRPDKMAVIAVGDFDVAEIQSRIAETFGGLTGPDTPRPDPDLSSPPPPEHVVVFADPEITRTSTRLDRRLDSREDPTYGGYKERLLDSLVEGALRERCRLLSLSDDPPFLGCTGGSQRITPTQRDEVAVVGTQDELLLEGLEALLVELERLRRHGALVHGSV
jgi:zinc protease